MGVGTRQKTLLHRARKDVFVEEDDHDMLVGPVGQKSRVGCAALLEHTASVVKGRHRVQKQSVSSVAFVPFAPARHRLTPAYTRYVTERPNPPGPAVTTIGAAAPIALRARSLWAAVSWQERARLPQWWERGRGEVEGW